MVQAVFIIGFFLLIAALMITRKIPTFIAMIILGIGIALIAGVPLVGKNEEGTQIGVLHVVLETGVSRMGAAISSILIGAWLGKMVTNTGVSKAIILKAAEFGGDRPLIVALAVMAAVTLLYTTVTGLGVLIMVGTIALPILLSVGIPAASACCMFLFAVT
ncbi:MAG: hypothetical protein FWG23_07925, partial [Eggerthellaceae bacterium]|nr:hypothetical protein [Eggerthellaceae bacterium]